MNSQTHSKHQEIVKKKFYSQVFQNVTYTMHKCPLLYDLYLNWCQLSLKGKIFLTYISRYVLDTEQYDLYTPIIGGLNYWTDAIYSKEDCGARYLDFEFDVELEERIFQTTEVIDKVVTNLLLRPILCKEIQSLHFHNNLDNNDFMGQGDGHLQI
ncbi:uncharacterized protein LOC130899489 [Diorhabda carinulata]|uniref:uncharacterized protein LOC130899489 n=1 Tax=Diorhabda carinulata TaxID=1163345 RepID=UPI0025A1AA4E|nr:uncharacterized protein LOC130899489 [Diorhabda carinulata]